MSPKTATKSKTARAQYTATAKIVASISGDTSDVTLSRRDGEVQQHAVFSLVEADGFERGLAEKIRHLALHPRTVNPYTYAKRPTPHAVALRFLRSVYPNAPQHLMKIQSCYSPGGWIVPQQGDDCLTFAFHEAGLNFVSDNQSLLLRFCVVVHIDKVPPSKRNTS